MQPLPRQNAFEFVDSRPAVELSWESTPEHRFDAIRGLLTALALALPVWAVILLLGWWIWS